MLDVRPLASPSVIHDVLTDPWVAQHIRHDAREPGYIEHPAMSYHGAYIDGELAGVFMAIAHTPWEIEVHAALLRQATRHGRALGRLFLDQLWQDAELMRVTAPVLSTLTSAANYCRKLGFQDEGVRRRACRVNGLPVDVIYLGLLRAGK